MKQAQNQSPRHFWRDLGLSGVTAWTVQEKHAEQKSWGEEMYFGNEGWFELSLSAALYY